MIDFLFETTINPRFDTVARKSFHYTYSYKLAKASESLRLLHCYAKRTIGTAAPHEHKHVAYGERASNRLLIRIVTIATVARY